MTINPDSPLLFDRSQDPLPYFGFEWNIFLFSYEGLVRVWRAQQEIRGNKDQRSDQKMDQIGIRS